MPNNSAHNKILQTAKHNLKEASKRLGLSDSTFHRLLEPKEKIELTLYPAMPDGKEYQIKAFIVRHNDALGPAKGGIRMTESVSLEEVSGLSMEMTWKTALMGIPFGGGKSGICCDPMKFSSNEKETIIRSFVRNSIRHLGPEIYIPAPDMGTNQEDMGHIRDCISYSEGLSVTKGCFVTGKPIILGGIAGRNEATGRGVVYSIIAAIKLFNMEIDKMAFTIQGFGNVGSIAALELYKLGAKIIAVSDISATVINENGLNIDKLICHVKDAKEVSGFKEAETTRSDAIIGIKSDCFIPAAAGGQITSNNADKIDTKIIAEGANAPITPEADEILQGKNIFLIPDILCNAGGVFVSYLEYIQETQREQMSALQVQKRLKEKMFSCFKQVYEFSTSRKLSMRSSAMDIAVGRVNDALYARGLLP